MRSFWSCQPSGRSLRGHTRAKALADLRGQTLAQWRPAPREHKKSLFHSWWKRPVFPLSCRQKPVAVGRPMPHRGAVIP